MHAPSRLYRPLATLMHAPTDAVIAVSTEGTVRVCPRAGVNGAEREVYSRDLLLAEGVVPTPAALQDVADRITADLGRSGFDLVA